MKIYAKDPTIPCEHKNGVWLKYPTGTFCRDCGAAKDPFPVKMMPGQEPYTPEELEKLYALVHDAAVAEELFSEEELEEAARNYQKR